MKKQIWKLEEISADIFSKDLSSQDREVRKRAEEALIKMGEASLDALDKIIKENSLPVAKLKAISILKEIKTKKAIVILLKALQDEKRQIRNKACAVIGEIQSKEAIPHLIEMLKLVNPDIRHSAQMALRLIGIASITPLMNSILEGNTRQMQSSEDIILSMGEEVEDLLIEKMEDKNNLIKALAIELLGKLKCEKALEKIINILNKETGIIVKQSCLKALGDIGVKSVIPELLKYTGQNSNYLKETALESLNKLKSKT